MLTPRPYQEEGRDFLAARTVALLADEMRVGKTPQAILAAQKVGARRILVVCPAIARVQWCAEWQRWAGRKAQVWNAFDTLPLGDRIYVASYDAVRNGAEALTLCEWDLLIVDEAHFVKSTDAKRAKVVFGNGGLAHSAKRVWCLTGTPAPNHAGELWVMLRAFGVVRCTYEEWVRAYCYCDDTGRPRGTKTAKVPELRALLAPVMLRRKLLEVAPQMPKVAFNYLAVEPTAPDLKLLFGLRQDIDVRLAEQIAKVEAALKRGDELDPEAAREARLLCAVTKAPGLTNYILDAFDAGLVKQTVVFGVHKLGLEMVRAGLVAAGCKAKIINGWTKDGDRQRIIEGFKAGRVEAIVANVQAAGTAIDLSAADHGFFLELDWTPANNIQAAARLQAVDKTRPVSYDITAWEGSVDAAVQRTLIRKTSELSAIFS